MVSFFSLTFSQTLWHFLTSFAIISSDIFVLPHFHLTFTSPFQFPTFVVFLFSSFHFHFFVCCLLSHPVFQHYSFIFTFPHQFFHHLTLLMFLVDSFITPCYSYLAISFILRPICPPLNWLQPQPKQQQAGTRVKFLWECSSTATGWHSSKVLITQSAAVQQQAGTRVKFLSECSSCGHYLDQITVTKWTWQALRAEENCIIKRI